MSSSASTDSAPLLIRADGGRHIGGGHVVRSLTLAAHLADRGMTVRFAIRNDEGTFVDRIESAGCDVIRLPEEPLPGPLLEAAWPVEMQQRDLDLLFAASPGRYGAVIVDHYGLDAYWEQGIRTSSDRVLAIDDLANRSHDVDLLVDQNWYGATTPDRYDSLVPLGCQQLLGPRYALLQPDYAKARLVAPPPHHPPQQILVSFGGSDPTGETAKVVTALADPLFAGINVDVVLGNPSAIDDRLRAIIAQRANTTLHIGLPTLAELLGAADLAIGASGSGTWERMCLDVPAIVTTTSEAHSGVTGALAAAGMTRWAGIGGQVSVAEYRAMLAGYVMDDPQPAAAIVDGYGAARVAEAFVPSRDARLTVRPAAWRDAPQFTGVDVGGPPDEPRQLDGPDTWLSEAARFRDDFDRSDRVDLVVSLGAIPIGRVRAQLNADVIRVSFSIDDLAAGRGLGTALAALLAPAAWTRRGQNLSYVGVAAGSPPPTADRFDLYGVLEFPTGTIATEK